MDVLTHIMFQDGSARRAVERYVELVPDSGIDQVVGEDGPGQVLHFTLAGRPFLAFDSPMRHAFDFTPATSIYLSCDTAEQAGRIFTALSEGGQVLMPLDAYEFNPCYGWCTDRHGVSWQVGVDVG